MILLKILLIAVVILLFGIFGGSLICYFIVFYNPKRKTLGDDEYDLPPGKEYQLYHSQMIEWTKEARNIPYERVEIKSFDGLTIRGRFYINSPDSPIEIMMHGYHGNLERDLSGGIFRALSIGHSVLIYDHRGSGQSDGSTLTFGINESRDCRQWIDYILTRIDPNAKIILSGVSMGAATAMITSGYDDLPNNVIGVVADCGYTSAEDIIKKVMSDIKLPIKLLYPLIKLGARLYGRFDIDEFSPIKQVEKSKIPTIFIHGDADDFVPCEMSQSNYEKCGAKKKKLVIIKDASHGLAYPVAPDMYKQELREFFESTSISKK